jgi:hypothetical protein
MSKSLADLRKSNTASRPERNYTVCLAQHLVAEVGVLTDELASLEPQVDEDGERTGPPRRLGEGDSPRAGEIRERLKELLDEMAEHDGELLIRAVEDGQWRRWANAHPARAEGEAGHKRDQDVAFGYCNADDLIDDLGVYVAAWNDEPLADGDWPMLAASIAGSDKKQIAMTVVAMHEIGLDLPKLRPLWSASLRSVPGSN